MIRLHNVYEYYWKKLLLRKNLEESRLVLPEYLQPSVVSNYVTNEIKNKLH